MTRFVVPIQMRFRDLDAMSHVNNAVYLTYCELARTQFYLQHSPKRSLEDVDFIVARIEIDFLSAAEWGDELEVSVWPSRVGTTSFTLSYEIRDRQSDRLIAKSLSILVSYDYAKRQKKEIPSAFRKFLQERLEPG